MNVFTRINRLERLLRKPVRGMKYKMRDGSWRVLPFNHKGFSDAVQHIDSPESRIVLAATTDHNHGLMLSLMRATMHPVNTEEPTPPVPSDAPTPDEEPVQV